MRIYCVYSTVKYSQKSKIQEIKNHQKYRNLNKSLKFEANFQATTKKPRKHCKGRGIPFFGLFAGASKMMTEIHKLCRKVIGPHKI